jgi:hypothetical protein
MLVANVINLGADIGAMGSALMLLMGGSALFYAVAFGAISVITAIFIPYHQYANTQVVGAGVGGVCRDRVRSSHTLAEGANR